jgi:hypothetical protein
MLLAAPLESNSQFYDVQIKTSRLSREVLPLLTKPILPLTADLSAVPQRKSSLK